MIFSFLTIWFCRPYWVCCFKIRFLCFKIEEKAIGNSYNINFSNYRVIKYILLTPAGQKIVYCATREKKFIWRVWSLMPEQIEGNKYTSKINVFTVSHIISFLLGSHKMNLFAPHGAIISILWPISRKNGFVCPIQDNKIHFMTR